MVRQDISAKTITVLNKYVVPETNRNVELPTLPINTIVTLPKSTTLLPNQTLDVTLPVETNQKQILIEPITNNEIMPNSTSNM